MANGHDPEDESDEDFIGQDEKEDEEYDGGAKSRRQKRKNIFVDDAAEDDGDADEDEDGEGNDENGEAPKRGQKRLKRSRFVDDIAAVDDQDDDDEEEDGVDDLIHDEGEELQDGAEDVVPRLEREAAFRQAAPKDDMTPEELEKFVKERYQDRAADLDVGRDAATSTVGQQGLLPRHADPKLWVMETRSGEEREAVVKLMQKAVTMAAAGTPLAITSVFAQDHLRGYIYIEAYKESHVKDAVRGLRNIYGSKAPKLVPVKEMVDAITVNRKAKAMIDEGSWVRVRTQLYKGDLAKVVSLDSSRGQAQVKLVPRMDYAAMAKARAEGGAANRFGRQAPGAVRPQARAFSPKEAADARLVVERVPRAGREGVWFRVGDRYFEDGYLLRHYNVRNLSLEEGVPPLEELQRFNQVGVAARTADTDNEGGELAQLMEALGDDERAAGGIRFGRDDKVIVIDGELQTLIGRVVEVKDDGFVRIRPLLEGLDELDLPARQLQKHFQPGDHVKVNSGQHEGQTGMVVRIEDPVCILVSDSTHEELQVFARDLTESSESATGLDSFGKYELHDLLMLDDGSVGVLIAVAKDSCKVLTNKSTPEQQRVRVCRALDIKRKIDNFRNISCVDATRKQIGVGDIVDIAAGRVKGKSGTVKFIHRQGLFLHVRELLENGGFIYMPAVKVRARGKAAAGLSAGLKANMMGAAIGKSPAHFGSNGSGPQNTPAYGQPRLGPPPSRGSFGGGRGGPDSRMIDRMVTIMKGPFRGYKGRIKNVTDREVRIELEAQARTVTVRRDQIPPEDGGAPVPRPAPAFGAGSATPVHAGMRTPAYPSATPMHPSMTPSHPGSATPMRDNAWVPIMATPRHPSSEDSSRASRWDAPSGGRAPSGWDVPSAAPGGAAGGASWTSAAAAPSSSTRASGWDLGPRASNAPLTSIPEAGAKASQPAWEPVAPAGLPAGIAADTGAPVGVSFSTFEGIAVKLKDSGRFGVVRSIQGATCTVALGAEDPDKGVILPEQPETVTAGEASLEPLLPKHKNTTIKVIGGNQALGRAGELLNVTDQDEVIIRTSGQTRELKVLPRNFVAISCLQAVGQA